jgi:hypothetical protein
MDAPARRWLTIAQAADLIGLHPKSVYQLCRKRKITYSKIPSLRGGRGMIRVDRIGLERMLEERAVQAVETPHDRRRRG